MNSRHKTENVMGTKEGLFVVYCFNSGCTNPFSFFFSSFFFAPGLEGLLMHCSKHNKYRIPFETVAC